jgi:uncharacterized protein (TIGR00266 family)
MKEQILGTTMPVLSITLDPGETVIAESGELSWMSSNIAMQTSTQFAGGGGAWGAIKRHGAGGTLFMTAYTAVDTEGFVAFATKLPGVIFPIDVRPDPGYAMVCHRHGFLAGMPGVELSRVFQQSLGAGIFGGEGFRLEKIGGTGRAWVELSGELCTYDLAAGQSMRVHPGHVGMFQETVNFGITTVPGIKNKLFGGDGIFLATLTGPGRVWLQSLTLARLAHALGEFGAKETVEAGAAGAVAGAAIRGIFGR